MGNSQALWEILNLLHIYTVNLYGKLDHIVLSRVFKYFFTVDFKCYCAALAFLKVSRHVQKSVHFNIKLVLVLISIPIWTQFLEKIVIPVESEGFGMCKAMNETTCQQTTVWIGDEQYMTLAYFWHFQLWKRLNNIISQCCKSAWIFGLHLWCNECKQMHWTLTECMRIHLWCKCYLFFVLYKLYQCVPL